MVVDESEQLATHLMVYWLKDYWMVIVTSDTSLHSSKLELLQRTLY